MQRLVDEVVRVYRVQKVVYAPDQVAHRLAQRWDTGAPTSPTAALLQQQRQCLTTAAYAPAFAASSRGAGFCMHKPRVYVGNSPPPAQQQQPGVCCSSTYLRVCQGQA